MDILRTITIILSSLCLALYTLNATASHYRKNKKMTILWAIGAICWFIATVLFSLSD